MVCNHSEPPLVKRKGVMTKLIQQNWKRKEQRTREKKQKEKKNTDRKNRRKTRKKKQRETFLYFCTSISYWWKDQLLQQKCNQAVLLHYVKGISQYKIICLYWECFNFYIRFNFLAKSWKKKNNLVFFQVSFVFREMKMILYFECLTLNERW